MADIVSLSNMVDALNNVNNQANGLEAMGAMLSLSDDQFTALAPGVIESYQQMLNNPTNQIALVQALNVSGVKSEDLAASFDDIVTEIDKSELSVEKRDFLKEIIAGLINALNSADGIAKRYVKIPIEYCNENAKEPQYAHISDSGMDVYALDDITVKPGETVLVPTGIKVALPPGYELQVRPKSGRALKTKLRVANTPGTIDQGYRDEIKVIIENVEPPIKSIHFGRPLYLGDTEIGYDSEYFGPDSIEYGRDFTIGKGEKFCQLVLMEVPKAVFYEVESVKELGENRNGGFGSTGLK